MRTTLQAPDSHKRCFRTLLAALLLAALALPTVAASPAGDAEARLCSASARQQTRDPRILAAVALARTQHALFGGQTVDRRGAIIAVGFHEAEHDRPPGESTPTWQRVADFWQALDAELPASFRAPDGAMVRIAPLRDLLAAPAAGAPGSGPDAAQRRALDSALLRAAIVDQPWSAVFISFLMKSAGFERDEFAFSDSHADYVDQALLATSAEARGEPTGAGWRACDIARTPPRPGDLVCHTREKAAAVSTLPALRERLALRRAQPHGNGVPMHCDLVTRADQGGDAKLETIGGNVAQSVSLRLMTLNAGKTLSRSHFGAAEPSHCALPPCRQNLSRKPWVVLLQSRR